MVQVPPVKHVNCTRREGAGPCVHFRCLFRTQYIFPMFIPHLVLLAYWRMWNELGNVQDSIKWAKEAMMSILEGTCLQDWPQVLDSPSKSRWILHAMLRGVDQKHFHFIYNAATAQVRVSPTRNATYVTYQHFEEWLIFQHFQKRFAEVSYFK